VILSFIFQTYNGSVPVLTNASGSVAVPNASSGTVIVV
jgi:hypothetical protein